MELLAIIEDNEAVIYSKAKGKGNGKDYFFILV